VRHPSTHDTYVRRGAVNVTVWMLSAAVELSKPQATNSWLNTCNSKTPSCVTASLVMMVCEVTITLQGVGEACRVQRNSSMRFP